jgi:hypothetical protein
MLLNLFLNTRLGESLKRQKALLDPVRLFISIGNEEDVIDLIIVLNTEGMATSQLYELGIDSKGVALEDIGGEYSAFTIAEKIRKGQPIDRITLKDSGEFYDSFEVVADSVGFNFIVDPLKGDNNLFEDWGQDIVGLFPPNLKIVINKMLQRYIQETKRIILA